MATIKKPTRALEANGPLKKGHFKLAMWGAKRGTPGQVVHDGDTVGLNTALNFSSRFLGVDTPEISFTIRTKDDFVPVGSPKWVTFWTSGEWKNMPLKAALRKHLIGRIGDGSKVAANHDKLAKQAKATLTQLIEADLARSGKTGDKRGEFEFFLAFSYEFLDQYGRMLCYLNAERSVFSAPEEANPLSYNERLLATGAAVPYFIFPNLQPFLGGQPFAAASLAPKAFWKSIKGATRLQQARAAVANARSTGQGVFAPSDRLILLPYELRYLARAGSQGPDRFVIDLGQAGGNKISKPEKYFSIARIEDRLFIAKEFMPLFVLNGWQVA